MNRDVTTIVQRIRSEKRRGVHLQPGVPAELIAGTLRPYTSFVPEEIHALYTAANGIRFGTFEVVPLAEMMWPELDCVSLHFWGNGDLDAARIVQGRQSCGIEFFGHDPPWQFEVTNTIASWLERLYDEWVEFGDVLDPWSCHTAKVHRLYTRH